MSSPVDSSGPKVATSISYQRTAPATDGRPVVRRTSGSSSRKLPISGIHSLRPRSCLIESSFSSVALKPQDDYPAPAKQARLRNSMLWGIGFLELANAGDLGANIFNQTPVPVKAICLMAIGGTLALLMVLVVVRDAQLARANVRVLWRERLALLREQKCLVLDNGEKANHASVTVKAQLDVNFREMGSEIVDRILVDCLMGFGCLLVGAGTLLAIAGANHRAYQASNLLSGYIGNAPAAVYALINAAWSTWIWIRARCHHTEILEEAENAVFSEHVRARISIVQRHATVSGITVLVAGVGSLVSATKWEGYVVLLPCIFSSVWINYCWRHRVAYERPLRSGMMDISKHTLLAELYNVLALRERLDDLLSSESLLSEAETLASTIDLLVSIDLFEQFCLRLHKHNLLWASILLSQEAQQDVFSPDTILQVQPQNIALINKIAHRCLRDLGSKQLTYRERYIIELLGAYTFESNLACSDETDSIEPPS